MELKKQLKIAFFFSSSYAGGAEICLLETIRGLQESGLECHAFFPADGPMADKVRQYVPVDIIFYEWWALQVSLSFVRKLKFLVRNLISTFQIAKTLRKEKFDYVVTNTITIPSPAFSALLAGKKNLWYIHEYGKEDHNLKFVFGKRISLFLMNQLATHFFTTSETIKEFYSPYFNRQKMSVLYNAVDFPDMPFSIPEAKELFTIVMAGRISQGKRQEDAVKAMALLKSAGYNVKLILLGHAIPDYLAYIKSLIADLDLKDEVEVIPFSENPVEVMKLGDLGLICSSSEAFGRVIIEAMKMGIPVLAAASGAVKEIIRDKVNGLLYASKDIKDLSEKITLIINDLKMREEVAREGYYYSRENFNLKIHAQRFLSVTEKI